MDTIVCVVCGWVIVLVLVWLQCRMPNKHNKEIDKKDREHD